ncbi:MAG: TonB-dependent receptor [Phycisphaerae bacterium]|nr:TonB-dependent receptor [Phycisphaerae bacterium]
MTRRKETTRGEATRGASAARFTVRARLANPFRPARPLAGARLLAALLAIPIAAASAAGQDEPSPPVETQPAASQPASTETDLEDFDDIGLLELEVPIVVTAARREQKITTVPYAVSVITAEDIRRSGARSIPDALRLVPGMDVADLSYGNFAVSPRGFHGQRANKTLVLVDGRQIFDSVMGGTVWGLWPFQLEDIKRIEVIRGPGGVTWGANAVNGVINIITKDPKDQQGLTFTSNIASRSSYKEYLGYAFADEKLQFRISGEYETSAGFKQGGWLLDRYGDEYKAGRISVHTIYKPKPESPDTLTLSAGSAAVGDNWPLAVLAGFNAWQPKAQANFVLGKWRHQVADDNEYELTAYVNDCWLMSGLPSFEFRYQQYALQFTHTFRPSEKHTLTWGIDTRFDYTDATNADPQMLSEGIVRTFIGGVYVQDEWRFAPRWALNLGVRCEYDSYGGFQPSGRAALSYQLRDDSLVYVAASRAFHMPTGARRFLEAPIADGFMYIRSDPHADAEKLMAYEVGYRAKFFDRLELNLNAFWHEYTDLIISDSYRGPPGIIQIVGGRTVAANLYGTELDFRYRATERLTFLGNYTYQQLDWTPGTSILDAGLITPPKHKYMLGARYEPLDNLHLSSHAYFVDRVRTPNGDLPMAHRAIDQYVRLDLQAEYVFWDERAAFSLGVRNLLDTGHLEGGSSQLGMGEVPRMYYAQLRVALK